MEMLSREAVDRARAFVGEHGRPLERARFAQVVDGGPLEPVVEELTAFRADGGGFGGALEPDARTPEASVLAALTALDILRMHGAPGDHPLVAEICGWLAEHAEVDPLGRVVWPFLPPAAQSSPHAPWWDQAEPGQLAETFAGFLANPGLALTAHLFRYAAAAPAIVTTARVGDAAEIFAVDSPTFAGATVDLAGQEARAIPGGAAHIQRAVNLGTLVFAAEALGAMEAALGLTVDYLKTRKQFGVPLMRFQTLTQRAADMYTSLELARSAVYFLAMTLAESPDDDTAVSRVKVIVGKAGRHVGQEAVQLHGGIGMTAEYAVGHHLARITAIEHTYGDTRFHLAKLARHVKDNDSRDLLS